MIRELFLSDFPLSSCVWQSTIFIVVGLVGSFILRHRSARAHQVLFLAMMAAVIVPIMSILVKHYELGMFVAEPVVIQSRAEDVGRVGNYGAPGIISAEDIEHKPGAIEEILPSAMAGSEIAEFPWRSVVLYGWIAASLILAARLLLTFALGVRLLKRALPLDCQKIEEALNLARAKLGIDKDVMVRRSRGVRSPVIWCWRRKPVLLVPSAAGRLDNGVDWAGVLCHELAHLKRRDHISGLLAELVACILPWHPLLWWAKSRLVRLSEQACDDWVLATGQPGTDYAESLLDLTPGGQMAFVPAVVNSKRGLADRVRRILKDSCGNPRTGALWALTVSILAACLAIGVACAQTRPAKPKTAAEQEKKPAKSLKEASIDGDVEQIKLQLSIGADVNAKDNRGRTALHNAARKGHVEIARLLIAGGADVNIRAENGQTPLHRAADRGRREMAELLILQGADVNAEDENGQTPLSRALHSKGGGREMVELLVSKGAIVPALHLAAHRGQLEKIRENLGDRANMDVRDEGGRTLLHYASSAGQTQVVELLIARGVDVDAKDKRGETPLYYAADAGSRNVAELLIADGADVNIQQINKGTPLHEAAGDGSIDVAELLIAHGANLDAKDKYGYAPLHYTAWWKDPRALAVAKLLLDKGADVNARNSWDGTPLTDAAESDNLALAELLVDRGANVNAACFPYGCTCLHHSISSNDVAEFLITKGADVKAKDRNGQTPLHSAVREGSRDIVELLIAKGADINAKNKNGQTPLHQACSRGDKDMADFLIAKGSDVNAKDGGGKTPLHRVTWKGRNEMIELLIDQGADIEAKNKWGGTPLHDAAQQGLVETTNLLLAKGADIEIGNRWGRRALYVAVMYRRPEVVKLLLAKGADINAKTYYDDTALHSAVGKGNKDMVELLLAKSADLRSRYHEFAPVGLAMLRDQKEMVRFLMDKGAEYSAVHVAAYFGDLEQVKGYLADGGDINAKSPSELTLLSSAIFGDQANMVEFLISKGANVNLRGGFGCTALHWASVISSRENIARLLLAKDSDVELRDKTGRIALHWAALKGHKAVVEMLLDKGADVNAKSGTIITEGEEDSGWSPLHQACAGGQKDVVEILIANGADISAKTEKGDTALSVAKKEYELKGKSEHKNIIELLRKHGAKE